MTFSITTNASISRSKNPYTNVQDYRFSFNAESLEQLQAIPAELFAVKISQSTNPDKRGKVVFKYMGIRVSEDSPFSDFAPQEVTYGMPVTNIKDIVVGKLGNLVGFRVSVNVKLPGKFAAITTANGRFQIFDREAFPQTEGYPGYYVNAGSVITAKFTPAMNQNNEYLRVDLTTELTAEELFVKGGRAKVWGEDAGSVASFDTAGSTASNAGELW